jgi:Branched-chain amino acid transport system / permease component
MKIRHKAFHCATALAFATAICSTALGRYILAIGGNDDASRLMGLPVDRVTFSLYLLSGLSGLAGVMLAAQFGAGQPTEGVGWELFAIASVVGRRHLTDGWARFSDHHLGRRASPWPDLQYSQFRKRSRLDQSIGLLAIGDSRGFSNVSGDVPVKVSFRPFSCQMRMKS